MQPTLSEKNIKTALQSAGTTLISLGVFLLSSGIGDSIDTKPVFIGLAMTVCGIAIFIIRENYIKGMSSKK